MEDKIAHYCIECGKGIPPKAKFCPFCGGLNDIDKLNQEPETGPEAIQEEKAAVLPETEISTGYTIYDPGEDFRGYRIVSLLNKDTEGLKYIAEKDGKRYLLKMLFQVGFASVNNLYLQQMRLSRIAKLKSKHLANVVEVNLSDNPCYLAVEYVDGKSLAEMKEEIPENAREAFISPYIPDIIEAAKEIRKAGLTLNKLALTGIMIDSSNKLIILSSAIKFEELDEREDVFIIGAVIAQFLAPAGLHKLVYSFEQLAQYKFIYINGVTVSMNKLLSECLHRNMVQRVTDLNELDKAFKALPEIKDDSFWQAKERSRSLNPSKETAEAPKPKPNQDWRFWIILLLVIVLGSLITAKVFMDRSDPNLNVEAYIPTILPENDSVTIADRFRSRDSENAAATIGTHRMPERRTLPQVSPDTPTQSSPAPQTTAPRRAPMPANFVYIEPGTFGFGRLEGNHNVSLAGFYISRHELTQAEWNRFMRPANVNSPGDRFPVENITWRQVVMYCNGRSDAENLTRAYTIRGSGANEVITCDFTVNGYRMPTEAEWEYAAKGGFLYNYSGSDDPLEVAWFRANAAGRTHQVGGKAANAKGLYDMTGNVSEWVWDWYNEAYPRSPENINPRGPSSGTRRSIRGGNILNGEGRNLNILWREQGNPNQAFPYVGVRLVRSH